MKKIIILILLLWTVPAWSQTTPYNWQFVGWYGAGTYPNVQFDPSVKNRVYLTSDVSGLWQSNNLGNTWTAIDQGLGGLMVSQLAIAPNNSNVLYATTNSGVYYSLNTGQSWNASNTANNQITFIRPNNYRSLTIDPGNAAHVCIGTQSGQVYCSSNYGQSWQNIPLPASASSSQGQPIPAVFFIEKAANDLVVCLTQEVLDYNFSSGRWTTLGQFSNITDAMEDTWLNLIYVVSQNGVAYMQDYVPGTWVNLAPVPASYGIPYRIDVSHPSSTTNQVYISWWNAGTYTGGVLMYQPQWLTWFDLDSNFYADQLSDPTRLWASISTVQESLKTDPDDPNVLFRTDNWGVWRSDYAGFSWNEKIIGAPDAVASDVAVTANGNIYVGSMDNGLVKSTNGGQSYTSIFPTVYANNTAGNVWRVAVIGNRIVATSSPWNENINQVIVSENGGLTFQLVSSGLPNPPPTVNTMWGTGYPKALAVDPNNPQTIYLGIDGDNGGGLFVSYNGGYNWSLTPGQPGSKRVYHGLAVDPANSNNIVWGASGNNGGVYVSKDKGNTFNYAETSMQWVFNLAIDPTGIIYAGGNQGAYATLYVSDPTETNFSMLHQFSDGVGTAVDGIAINPTNPKVIAVSTVNWSSDSPCVYYLTTDAGQTWTQINGNLPAGAGASEMTWDTQGKNLYIARYAGSVWRVNLQSSI